jgi:hypothetical protein
MRTIYALELAPVHERSNESGRESRMVSTGLTAPDSKICSVMPDRGEVLVPQTRHDRDQVLGHRSLAGLRVIRQVGGCRGLAVPAQVRAHDPIAGAREDGSEPVPGGVRPGTV